MKNNKAFTLVELLATIVILGIILLIAIPNITKLTQNAKKETFENSVQGIIKAGNLYHSHREMMGKELEDVTFVFPNDISGLEFEGKIPESGSMKITAGGEIALAISNGKYCATKGFKEAEITITKDIKNCVIPVLVTNMTLTSSTEISLIVGETSTIETTIEPSDATNKKLSYSVDKENIVTISETGVITAVNPGSVVITISTTDGSNISETINVTVAETYTNGIMQSINNCINEGTCPNGTIVKVAVNDNELYKFYVIKDDGNTITLIMSETLGNNVAWIDAEDYTTENNKDETPDTCDYTSCNDEGPITAINYLDGLTDEEWSNIPPRDYTYSGLDDNGNRKYEDITRTMRARMITYEEVNTIKTTNNGSLPGYIYGGSPYWLSTAYSSGSEYAWIMGSNGSLVSDIFVFYSIPIGGLRPVIELSK